MTEKKDPSEVLQEVLQSMMAVVETTSAVIDAAASYREKALTAGFNETVAEQMALQFHSTIMASLMQGAMAQQTEKDD